MEQEFAADNLSGIALAAVNNFKVLEQAMDQGALVAPLDVAMLDYTGFKLSAIAKSAKSDWALAADTVKESSAYWKALESKITDKGLRDLMNSIHAGLEKAVAEKDVSQLAFGGKMELDTVDLLEHYFVNQYKTSTGVLPVIDDPVTQK